MKNNAQLRMPPISQLSPLGITKYSLIGSVLQRRTDEVAYKPRNMARVYHPIILALWGLTLLTIGEA